MALSSLEWFDALTDMFLGASPDKRYKATRQKYCRLCNDPILVKTTAPKPVCWKCRETTDYHQRRTGQCLSCGNGIDRRAKRCRPCANGLKKKNEN